MNFLAHIYLSGEEPLIQVGNFIADAVKGDKYIDFDEEIRIGILLHRKIDSFTDSHPVFRTSVRRLFDQFRHFSPVIVDMFYDHFLAKYWNDFHDNDLDDYIKLFYHVLDANYDSLPAKTQKLLPILISENWLLQYRTTEGINNILSQMDRRTNNRSNMRLATQSLVDDYTNFETDFFNFMPAVVKHAASSVKLIRSHLQVNQI